MARNIFSVPVTFIDIDGEIGEFDVDEFARIANRRCEEEGGKGFAALGRGKRADGIICGRFEEVAMHAFYGCDLIEIRETARGLEVRGAVCGEPRSCRVRFLSQAGIDRLYDEQGAPFCITKRKVVEEIFDDKRATMPARVSRERKAVA